MLTSSPRDIKQLCSGGNRGGGVIIYLYGQPRKAFIHGECVLLCEEGMHLGREGTRLCGEGTFFYGEEVPRSGHRTFFHGEAASFHGEVACFHGETAYLYEEKAFRDRIAAISHGEVRFP